jgi:hypothetical protein
MPFLPAATSTSSKVHPDTQYHCELEIATPSLRDPLKHVIIIIIVSCVFTIKIKLNSVTFLHYKGL